MFTSVTCIGIAVLQRQPKRINVKICIVITLNCIDIAVGSKIISYLQGKTSFYIQIKVSIKHQTYPSDPVSMNFPFYKRSFFSHCNIMQSNSWNPSNFWNFLPSFQGVSYRIKRHNADAALL